MEVKTVRTTWHLGRPRHTCAVGLVLVALIALGTASCTSPQDPMRRMDPDLDPGRPKGNPFFTQASYQPVQGTLPTVADAENVNDDEICGQCHPAYAKSFAQSVHRGGGCESCHGPASKHVEARGKKPGLIFSFKNGRSDCAGGSLPAVPRRECQCPRHKWRTSKHATNP